MISENTHGGVRSHYFIPGDIVWVRPAGLPYWPAEVIEINEVLNMVRARLLDPPPEELLKANQQQEVQQWKRMEEKERNRKKKRKRRESIISSSTEPADCPSTEKRGTCMEWKEGTEANCSTGEKEDHAITELCTTGSTITPSGDVVTTSGMRVYFFDKLFTPDDIEACVEQRLRRSAYDVHSYEGAFYKAVLHANRLVRITLHPDLLQPYQICGIGVVYSLMRCHTAAPRQPHTGKVIPQPGVIRLRKGFENAARDLMGFEYIWVLFQFSYAAAISTSVGQDYVLDCRRQKKGEGEELGGEGEGGARGHKGKGLKKKKPLLKDISREFDKVTKERRTEGGEKGKQLLLASSLPLSAPVPNSNAVPFGREVTDADRKEEGEESNEERGGKKEAVEKASGIRGISSDPCPATSPVRICPTPATAAGLGEEAAPWGALRNWRHRQGLSNARGYKTMIIPPRDSELRGVFATRSPHRPNFIGMSCVKLVSVQGLDIHILDHDLLHGTPVLDIKPYLPFCDAHPTAKAGWVEELEAKVASGGGEKGDHKYDAQEMFVHRIFETEK